MLKFSSTQGRTYVFGLAAILTLALFSQPLKEVLSLLLQSGYDSYRVLVPFCSAYLIWSRRKQIFSSLQFDPIPGLLMAVFCVGFLALSHFRSAPTDSFLALELRYLALLFWLSGLFSAIYGRNALKRAAFPLALLVLSIPLPPTITDKVITSLQTTSTSLSYFLFSLLGTPVFREGFRLHVPGVTIEVAKECSGINSSMALVFTLLLVGYETLRTNSRRLILVLLAIPISIAKNAIRIVTLTLLAVHVDRGFLTGSLHHKGGVVFYLIALVVVYPLWRLLQKSEDSHSEARTRSHPIENDMDLRPPVASVR